MTKPSRTTLFFLVLTIALPTGIYFLDRKVKADRYRKSEVMCRGYGGQTATNNRNLCILGGAVYDLADGDYPEQPEASRQ